MFKHALVFGFSLNRRSVFLYLISFPTAPLLFSIADSRKIAKIAKYVFPLSLWSALFTDFTVLFVFFLSVHPLVNLSFLFSLLFYALRMHYLYIFHICPLSVQQWHLFVEHTIFSFIEWLKNVFLSNEKRSRSNWCVWARGMRIGIENGSIGIGLPFNMKLVTFANRTLM